MIIDSIEAKFSYGKNPVLNGMSFVVPEGEITFLAGENGSGKTTWILNAVSLLGLDGGRILYDGKTFEEVRPAISVAFDTTPLYPRLSVRDNLRVLYNVDASDPAAHRFLNDMGLDDYLISKHAGKLSYGQKHRIGIGGALLRDVPCYILDEPDLGLDPVAWNVVRQRILELKENGRTVLITGQNYPMIQEIATYIIVISGGRCVFQGDANSFLAEHCKSEENRLRNAFENIVGTECGLGDEK